MALPPSTANWHWKNKNVTRWAKEWFERELLSVTITDTEGDIRVSRVTEVDGDVELGQRKSKLITIYDCKVVLEWTGTASDGTEVEGKLTIPEVSHEITLDGLSDYAYSWSLTTASSTVVNALFNLARKRLPTALEAKFAEFPVAIIDTHGKDLTVSTDPSRAATPAPSTSASASSSKPSAASTAQPVKKADAKAVNTTSISVDANLVASAADLYALLTDADKIPRWTHAAAESEARVGGNFSLFGGGVKGQYIELTPEKKIVQSWALQSPTWPSGHTGTLTIALDQASDHTKITFSLVGVPIGMHDEITKNLEGYYIHGFKSIGLGTEL
ncbi:hypothetical protein HGRIS_012715 [Hohenbuehelia grisea]|uniref:Activator of Hsp90 ATPase AHSA1-like N-terminal domain-containing protein n=1 Tax=Hohenbuehelia grisea TaxID=104357 RepID=A0ABR3IT75_9AGAR